MGVQGGRGPSGQQWTGASAQWLLGSPQPKQILWGRLTFHVGVIKLSILGAVWGTDVKLGKSAETPIKIHVWNSSDLWLQHLLMNKQSCSLIIVAFWRNQRL